MNMSIKFISLFWACLDWTTLLVSHIARHVRISRVFLCTYPFLAEFKRQKGCSKGNFVFPFNTHSPGVFLKPDSFYSQNISCFCFSSSAWNSVSLGSVEGRCCLECPKQHINGKVCSRTEELLSGNSASCLLPLHFRLGRPGGVSPQVVQWFGFTHEGGRYVWLLFTCVCNTFWMVRACLSWHPLSGAYKTI